MEVPRTQTMPADGLILLDKPAGLTSHDCVQRVRRFCPRKTKVGHGGTLDPFSTGLLILLVGKATRLASLLQGMEKRYEGVLRFGIGTDSFDRDGQVVEEGPPPTLTAERWQEIANGFIGKSDQVPPAFSAKRLQGRRAYDLARQGKEPELRPCPVEIFEFSVEPEDPAHLRFTIRCSSGTYIRAIARDLGKKVSSPAHCRRLSRAGVGPFSAEHANTLEDPFSEEGFIPFDQVDLGIPVHRVNFREERLVLFGQKISAPRDLQGFPGPVKVESPSGRFLAVGRLQDRQIQPVSVFARNGA